MADDRPGEFDLIKRYFAPLARDPGSAGLTDDAAVLSPCPGYDLVLTKDVLAADIHFFADDAPEAIAAKALRVNLSDLAAKGATARGYLLGLALPANWSVDWLERFCNGLAADQAAYGVQLLGGDTIRSGNGLQVSITAIGEVPAGGAIRRAGVAPGDVVFVSGTIGDAAAGLKARLDPEFCKSHGLCVEEEKHILARYLLPRPRLRLAPLIARYASASMDVSDGLFADSFHLAKASGADLEIDIDRIPISPALVRMKAEAPDEVLACLDGGDDYEILCAVPADRADAFAAEAADVDCPLQRIGLAHPGTGEVRLISDGCVVSLPGKGGFRHF